MSEIDDGGLAFPSEYYAEQGMTLRDYFAAAALPLAYAHWKSYNDKEKEGEQPRESLVAEEAYTIADAMIEARKEEA
jgi:UDP-glucose 4-epimerase